MFKRKSVQEVEDKLRKEYCKRLEGEIEHFKSTLNIYKQDFKRSHGDAFEENKQLHKENEILKDRIKFMEQAVQLANKIIEKEQP